MTQYTQTELIAIYTEDQRRNVRYPGELREETPHVIRHIAADGGHGNYILYSALDGTNADQVIAEQIAFFSGRGADFEWKLYDYDQPPDLRERLARRGFEIEAAEAIMVLPMADAPDALLAPIPPGIVKLTTPAELAAVQQIEEAVWAEDFSWIADELGRKLAESPHLLSVYAALVDGQAVSAAWITFSEGSRFAGLWGGSTRAEYRRRGLYSTLLAVRAQEAVRRGVEFLTVDAGPMSRPILEKFGFQTIAISHPCQWKTGGANKKG